MAASSECWSTSLHHVAKIDLRIDFIELALHGKKIGFGKVIKMIDAMVATLLSWRYMGRRSPPGT